MIAFIGTRTFETLPAYVRDPFLAGAAAVGERGAILVTGAAQGADQAAAEAALRGGWRVQLVLPWPTYEIQWTTRMKAAYGDYVKTVTYNPDHDVDWTRSVFIYHPAAHRLSQGSLRLHARNYGIVSRAEAVIAAPSSPIGNGGTGQGMRIGRALRIPVLNLWLPADRDRLFGLLWRVTVERCNHTEAGR